MATITVKDGTEIYYKDWGSGRPVLFSHGWPLTSDAWEDQMVFLAARGFRCIAHDRRGHGRSSQPYGGSEMNTYADDLGGAASATGHGEAIIRVNLTKHAVDRLRAGASPQEAVESAVSELERVKGTGGLILADPRGRLAFAFNTARMARAWVSADGQVGAAFGT